MTSNQNEQGARGAWGGQAEQDARGERSATGVLLVGPSALEYWRRVPGPRRCAGKAGAGRKGASGHCRAPRAAVPADEAPGAFRSAPCRPPVRAAFRGFDRRVMEALSAPVHVMVGDPLARRDTVAFASSLHLGPVPPGSSVPAGGGVSVASPEMCFAQLANTLPFAQLVLLGCELCGIYMPDRRPGGESAALQPSGAAHGRASSGWAVQGEAPRACDAPLGQAGMSCQSCAACSTLAGASRPPCPAGPGDGRDEDAFAPKRRRPLTTPEAIWRFLEASPGLPGRRSATRALRYVHELSASPMESVLAMLLCLPRHYGGLGLPRPRLNARVDLDARARAISGHDYHLVDLLWEGKGVGAEYDGRSAHARAEAFDEDRLRADALKAMGVDPVSFIAASLRDDLLFCSQASYIAERLHIRSRPLDERWRAAREGLRRDLFGKAAGSARPVWPGERPGLPCLLEVLDAGTAGQGRRARADGG